MTMETIPDLSYEIDGDQINLEQNAGLGDVDRVTLNRIHLLHLAQRMGLVREMSASGSDELRTHGELARDVDRLRRNMLRVRSYALDLQDDFRKNADWEHADLTYEMSKINSLVDLLDMAVDDFSDQYEEREPAPYEPGSADSKLTEDIAEEPQTEQRALL